MIIASDLVGRRLITLSHRDLGVGLGIVLKKEERKIFSGQDVIVGSLGTLPVQYSRQLEQLLSLYTHEELLEHQLPDYFLNLNRSGWKAEAMIGAVHDGNADLWYYHGVGLRLHHIVGEGAVASPSSPKNYYSKLELEVADAAQARELAIDEVRKEIINRPNDISGLEVVQLDSSGVRVVYYEHMSLPWLTRVGFHTFKK